MTSERRPEASGPRPVTSFCWPPSFISPASRYSQLHMVGSFVRLISADFRVRPGGPKTARNGPGTAGGGPKRPRGTSGKVPEPGAGDSFFIVFFAGSRKGSGPPSPPRAGPAQPGPGRADHAAGSWKNIKKLTTPGFHGKNITNNLPLPHLPRFHEKTKNCHQ